MGKKTFKELTTLKIGGNIENYFEVSNISELKKALSFSKRKKISIFIIGGGSDILVSDRNFDGVVIKYTGCKVKVRSLGNYSLLTSEAGLWWDDLVAISIKNNLQGIECLSGIPGTVGAAPVQNIGAYGQELKDTFHALKAYDIVKGKFVTFHNHDCDFGYRESMFKKKANWQRFIIVSVTLKLNKHKTPEIKYASLKKYFADNKINDYSLKTIRNAVLKIREGKFENFKKVPNAGSFFKNPVLSNDKFNTLQKIYGEIPGFKNMDGTYKCFAGWFIESAGWKGKKYKNAEVSPSHALILTNPNAKASAKDVLELSEKIIESVYEKFSVKLENEVQFVNF